MDEISTKYESYPLFITNNISNNNSNGSIPNGSYIIFIVINNRSNNSYDSISILSYVIPITIIINISTNSCNGCISSLPYEPKTPYFPLPPCDPTQPVLIHLIDFGYSVYFINEFKFLFHSFIKYFINNSNQIATY